jgi:hypothetical protein
MLYPPTNLILCLHEPVEIRPVFLEREPRRRWLRRSSRRA